MWQIGTHLINEIEHFYVYRIHELGFVQYADDNLYCYDIAKSIADELNKEKADKESGTIDQSNA